MKTKFLLAVLATAALVANATAQNLEMILEDGTKEVWVIDWSKVPVIDLRLTNHFASVAEILSSLKRETNYDAVLLQLAKSGEICRVRGHAWGGNWDGIFLDMVRPDGYQERVCSVCGKFESRSMPPWPTPGPVPMPWQWGLINTNGIIELTNIFWTNSTMNLYQDAKP